MIILENQKVLDPEVIRLVVSSNINEEFDESAEYKFVGYFKDKLVGTIVYRKQKIDFGDYLPRLIHAIIHENYRNHYLGAELLKATEKYLKEDGYTQVIAIIDENHLYMRKVAESHGYKEYADNQYYKNL